MENNSKVSHPVNTNDKIELEIIRQGKVIVNYARVVRGAEKVMAIQVNTSQNKIPFENIVVTTEFNNLQIYTIDEYEPSVGYDPHSKTNAFTEISFPQFYSWFIWAAQVNYRDENNINISLTKAFSSLDKDR